MTVMSYSLTKLQINSFYFCNHKCSDYVNSSNNNLLYYHIAWNAVTKFEKHSTTMFNKNMAKSHKKVA